MSRGTPKCGAGGLLANRRRRNSYRDTDDANFGGDGPPKGTASYGLSEPGNRLLTKAARSLPRPRLAPQARRSKKYNQHARISFRSERNAHRAVLLRLTISSMTDSARLQSNATIFSYIRSIISSTNWSSSLIAHCQSRNTCSLESPGCRETAAC